MGIRGWTLMRIRLTLSYDGSLYHGFQRQMGKPTVQGTLEHVFQRLLGPGRVIGASRTDSGVHAVGQVIVWAGPCVIPLDSLAEVVNRRLPQSMEVRDPETVPEEWDPRRSAKLKQYSYRLWVGPESCPLPYRSMVYRVVKPPNWAILQQAAELFLGTHDFWAFRSEGSSAKTTVRTILASRWESEKSGRLWVYRVAAPGFLYHMVRIMVASMVAAGHSGDLDLVRGLLRDPRKRKAGVVAPAHGLTLDCVKY